MKFKTFEDFKNLHTAVNGCKDPKFSCQECPFSKCSGYIDCRKEKEIGLNAALELLLTPQILNKYLPISCPEYGEFIGWKKTRGPLIVKLKITENAKRSSAFGRKCRCSEAVVLAIENIDGTPSDKIEAASLYDMCFIYRVGETVSVSDFDDNREYECAPGIHFFITRQEAVDYST